MVKVILLSFIEGFTEFLPISSTGHLILINHFIKLSNNINFTNTFMVVIQLGSILAVIKTFFNELNPLVKKNQILWIKILVASIPAAVIGLIFDDYIESKLFTPLVVAITLIFYGIVLLITENRLKNKKPSVNELDKISYKKAFIIGIFQVLALIPGTSRSMVTILSGLIMSLRRDIATKFSFFLAVPIMFGASFLKLAKTKAMTLQEILYLLIGFAFSYIFAKIFVNFLMKYIRNHNFNIFGIYRIILGIIVLGVLF